MIILYDTTTGEILSTIHTDRAIADMSPPVSVDEAYVYYDASGDDQRFTPQNYVIDLSSLAPIDKPYITPVSQLTTTTNVAVELTDLPNCSAQYFNKKYQSNGPVPATDILAKDEITDSVLSITSDLAGEYNIVLSAPAYLDTIVSLIVEDS